MLLRALCLTVLAASSTADVTDRQVYTVPLPDTRAVSIAMTVGRLTVTGERREDVVVEVVRNAPTRELLERIPFRIDASPAEVHLVARQADGGTDPALRTDVTLRVPHAAVLKGEVMEGRVVLSSLSGDVNVDLRRGPIDAVNVQGTVRLEAGIGDVTARDMRLAPDGLIRLRAFNGDVRLTLAERPVNARVMALVLNGSVQSQIPLVMKQTWGPRWGEATLGAGEPVISLDVVTGAIEIAVK